MVRDIKNNLCRNGHERTPENTFSNSRGTKSCRLCRNKSQRDYIRKHPEKRKDYTLKWIANNKEKNREIKAKWKAANGTRAKAWAAVEKATKNGDLLKEPCSICHDPNSQAHHEDYSKPLDVIWLCPKHHGERHRQINDEGRE